MSCCPGSSFWSPLLLPPLPRLTSRVPSFRTRYWSDHHREGISTHAGLQHWHHHHRHPGSPSQPRKHLEEFFSGQHLLLVRGWATYSPPAVLQSSGFVLFWFWSLGSISWSPRWPCLFIKSGHENSCHLLCPGIQWHTYTQDVDYFLMSATPSMLHPKGRTKILGEATGSQV